MVGNKTMTKTKKAVEQIRKLKDEIKDLNRDVDRIRKSNYPYDYKNRESNRIYNKIYKKEEKITEIESIGLSSGEIGSLKKAVGEFKTLKREKDIGSTRYIKVGYFKPLKQYVKVIYHKYSGLMRSVKGMSSLAGTIDIVSIKPITETLYNKLIAGQGVAVTRFSGAKEVKKFKV